MNPWVPFLGVLGYNLHRHRRGRSTLCSTTRRYLPARIVLGALGALLAWFVPHILNGYDS